jgi:hypothetical protein
MMPDQYAQNDTESLAYNTLSAYVKIRWSPTTFQQLFDDHPQQVGRVSTSTAPSHRIADP